MIKIIGSTLIILSTTLIGIYYSKNFSVRLSQIRQIQYALSMLESEIIYSSTPLIEALNYVGEKSSGIIGDFFKDFSNRLYKREIEGVLDGFRDSISEFKEKILLKEDEIEVVSSFIKTIESGDVDAQKKNFNITMKKLEVFEKRAEDVMIKNEKLYKYLGVCSGLLVVIILV